MERDSWWRSSRLNGKTNAVTSTRENVGAPRPGGSSDLTRQTTSSDVVPQWGNRKRLRCMKIQAKDETTGPIQQSNTRFDRPILRSEKDEQQPSTSQPGNAYLNLRQRSHSLVPPVSHRILRNLENSSAMRGQSNYGSAHDKRSTNYHRNNNNNINDSNTHYPNKSDVLFDRTAHDSKKGCGGSSSGGSGDAVVAAVWPPRFMIGLTNKEKEEDFWVLKGSKLPQRPKKRAKLIQRTLNLVSPGTWLCDLTLERYEVRETKVSKKRPRGLKAMTNIDSDSE